ncbi:MAG: hypothetical protein U0K81_06495 [Paludibacteraceae bacterium]|nr:hypothetical protein [Paludibacteraceae bacterium]
MAIKISDLSVGDWVQDKNGIYAKVLGIENWSNGYFLNIELHGVNVGVTPLTSAHPIPITAEMLEANGWKKGQRGEFYHYLQLDKNSTLYVHASTNGWRMEITYDAAGILRTTHLMPNVVSIHQLQHALRLAGVEKEINL